MVNVPAPILLNTPLWKLVLFEIAFAMKLKFEAALNGVVTVCAVPFATT